ncbi:TIGR03826 family flagellar region protein [Scopulibacillus cellulosilyticus]|uniref:TIGR03826 family flagellar region protein n=1 Tax=Scopulibacillus cellulosilyticus TaxID=2665665 RepID=A0ABW2PWS3_9BACL
MAELFNCKNCGKLFVKVTASICPSCRKIIDEKYDVVYDYIRQQENRQATVSEVHEATGVEESLIYGWVREGRLKTADFINLHYPCRTCGQMIQTGTICDNCSKQLAHELKIYEKQKEQDQSSDNDKKTYYTEL